MEFWEEYVIVFLFFNEVIVKEKFIYWIFWILFMKGVGSVLFVFNLFGFCYMILED